MKIVDGAALVNILKPINCQTFGDYFAKIVFPFLKKATEGVERLDVVWDQYFPDSLKNSTREKRWQGVRRKVTVNGALPGNWSTFLRCDQNKSELFYQLAEQIAQVTLPGKVIISIKGEDVVSSSGIDKDGLAPCNHEEADTRVFLHVAHVSKTFSKVSVKVGDTDVVVLAVSLFDRLNITELWLEFAAGKAMRFIPVHKVVRSFSIPYLAFPFFHAYSGCDTCSAFNGKGKKTAMMAWIAVSEVTPVFLKLSHKPSEITEDDITILE